MNLPDNVAVLRNIAECLLDLDTDQAEWALSAKIEELADRVSQTADRVERAQAHRGDQ